MRYLLPLLVVCLTGCGGGPKTEAASSVSGSLCNVRMLKPYSFEGRVSCSEHDTAGGGFENVADVIGLNADVKAPFPFDWDGVVTMPSPGTSVSFDGCTDWSGKIAWGYSAGAGPRHWALNLDVSCRTFSMDLVIGFSGWGQ